MRASLKPVRGGRLLIALCGALIAFSGAPAKAQQTTTAVVTAGALNMRTGPGTGYGVITSVPGGTSVYVLQCTTSRTWCEIQYSGRVGWSSANYLRFQSAGPQPPPQQQPTPQPPPQQGGIVQATTTVSLNMRQGPSTQYSVIRAIPAGATVAVYRCTDGYVWCEVGYAGSTGWASARYLRASSPQYNQQPIPNVGAQLGLQLFQFILGQFAGGGQPDPGQQPPQQRRPGPNEVCFYRDVNYGGPATCASMGQADASLPSQWNDTISSIAVGSNAQVQVCQNVNYGGACQVFSQNVSTLPSYLNDEVSSFRTTQFGGNPNPGPQPNARACFYQDYNFQGAAFCLSPGQNISFLSQDWNDRISSIRVDQGVTITVCEDANYGGRCAQYSSSVSVLQGERNDVISSIRVQ